MAETVQSYPPASGSEHASTSARDSFRKWHIERGLYKFINIELDKLPEAFTSDIYETKCDLAYRHIYDSYFGPGQNAYEMAAA